jgi:hypothetical protein
VQQARWYRQTSPCMVEQGSLHPGLAKPLTKAWGATLEGETRIRRSALGLDPKREVLYIAVTNYTTARILAQGMQYLGATTLAQLDVNWSYPRFLLFERADDGDLTATSLFRGFAFQRDQLLRNSSDRDFFYILRAPGTPP